MERYAPAPVLRAALRATVSRRAGSEALYLVLGLPLGIAGFYLLIILLVPGILLTASVVGTIAGLGLLIVATQLGRMVGAGHRWLAARCLGSQVTAPAPFRPGTGIIGRIDARLRDGAAWRATGYVLVKFPLAVLGCYVALVAWIGGLFYLTYPAWWWLSGAAVRADHGTGKPAVVMNPLPVGGLQVGTWPRCSPRWPSTVPRSRSWTCACRRPTPTRGCARRSGCAPSTRGRQSWCSPSTSRPGTPRGCWPAARPAWATC